jgi:protein-L-isoaspartate O-methyltransferase
MRSVPRLYSEDHREKLIIHEVGVGGYQSAILSCIVRRRYQATTSEDIEDLVFAVVICSV